MINPFTIYKGKRYTLDGKTIIIEEVLLSNIIWYDLCKWWNNQNELPILNNSPKFWFIMNAQKYKYK